MGMLGSAGQSLGVEALVTVGVVFVAVQTVSLVVALVTMLVRLLAME